jgi:hypothetical protein
LTILKAEMSSRSNTLLSATNSVDVSIEFAHVDVASYDSSDIARSGRKASELAKYLTETSKSYSVVLLIDDKDSTSKMTPNDVGMLIHDASNWLPVDYVVFESRLADYKLDLFESIQPAQKISVRKQVDRYEAKSGRLACSHDIAIWHLLRLGIIAPDASTVVPVASRDQYSTRSFFANSVVSILNEEDRDAENRAMNEILRYSRNESVPSRVSLTFV